MIPYSNLFFSNPLGFVALNKSMYFDKILFQIRTQLPFGNNHIQCLDFVIEKIEVVKQACAIQGLDSLIMYQLWLLM